MVFDPRQLPNLWPASSLAAASGGAAREGHVLSGYPALDAALGGGWPVPALIELLADQEGIGELTLLVPLLKHCISRCDAAVALWLNTPHVLHALALAQQGLDPARQWSCRDLSERDAAWAMELGLKSGGCSIVIGWLRSAAPATVRRLKLATATGHTIGILFRRRQAAALPSPASVRIVLEPQAAGLALDLIKVQGRRPSLVVIDLDARLDRPVSS